MTRDEITAHKAASTREIKALRKGAEWNKKAAAHYRTLQKTGHAVMPREEIHRRRCDVLQSIRQQYRMIRVQIARRKALDAAVPDETLERFGDQLYAKLFARG